MNLGENLDTLRRWVTRLNALLTEIVEMQNKLDELSVQRHLALAAGHKRRWQQLSTEFSRTNELMQVALSTLVRWTEEHTLYRASELVTDVRVRLTQALEAHETWRRGLAHIEAIEALQGFGDDFPEAEARAHVEALEREFIMMVNLAMLRLPPTALEV